MDRNGSPEHQTWEMAVGGCCRRPPPPLQWPLCPLYGTVGAQLLRHAGSICQWQWGAPQHQHGPSITRPLYTSACPQLQPSDFTQSLNPELSQSDWWGSRGDIDGYVHVRKFGNTWIVQWRHSTNHLYAVMNQSWTIYQLNYSKKL